MSGKVRKGEASIHLAPETIGNYAYLGGYLFVAIVQQDFDVSYVIDVSAERPPRVECGAPFSDRSSREGWNCLSPSNRQKQRQIDIPSATDRMASLTEHRTLSPTYFP